MSDLIDRQAAIDALGEKPLVWDDLSDFDLGKAAQWSDDVDAIKALPSAQPKSSESKRDLSDTISRQDAIMAVKMGALSAATLYGRTDEGSTALYETVRAIKAIPSAQPEITLESAIDYLHSIGWMQEHDELMYKQGYKHGKSKGIKRGMAIARRKHEEEST